LFNRDFPSKQKEKKMPLLDRKLRDELQKITNATNPENIKSIPAIRELREDMLDKVTDLKKSLSQRLQNALATIDGPPGNETLRQIAGLRDALTNAKQQAEAPGINIGTGDNVGP
jgi:hypothetical protein